MEETPTSTGTTVPAEHGGVGFPPFKTETFPSQIFWLAITFGFLFVVLWRFAGPRIQGVIAERRTRITLDLAQAEKHRRDSEAASVTYQSALTAARGRALALADENRKRIVGDVASARAKADAEAADAMAKAEARIAVTRERARANIAVVAQDAAADIVSRLIGETVTPADAAAAVRNATGG